MSWASCIFIRLSSWHTHALSFKTMFKEGLCMQRKFAVDQLSPEIDQKQYRHLTLPSHPSGPLEEQPTISTLAYNASFPASYTKAVEQKPFEDDLCNLPTERMAVATLALGGRENTLREIPQLIAYTAGASVIVSLYMIIPLMVMLGVFLPETWNRFLIAIEILVLGEFAICTILMRTTKKRQVVELPSQQFSQEKQLVRIGDSQAFKRSRLSNSTSGVRAYRSISMAAREHQVS